MTEKKSGWHSANFYVWEAEKIKNNEHNGCPACGSKETGKWITSGSMGSTDQLYFCQSCGLMRMGM